MLILSSISLKRSRRYLSPVVSKNSQRESRLSLPLSIGSRPVSAAAADVAGVAIVAVVYKEEVVVDIDKPSVLPPIEPRGRNFCLNCFPVRYESMPMLPSTKIPEVSMSFIVLCGSMSFSESIQVFTMVDNLSKESRKIDADPHLSARPYRIV